MRQRNICGCLEKPPKLSNFTLLEVAIRNTFKWPLTNFSRLGADK